VRILKRNASEDLALVQRCKHELPHQHKAFEQLVGAYKDMIFTLCYRMTGNASDAEDLLQEILTKLFLGLDKFEGRSAFSSWLYRVSYNHCLNFLASRKEEKRQTDPLPEQDMIRDPATEASSADLDVKEISSILGIGLSATKMRLLRTREMFKKSFEVTR
jgi:RNA polymerase sigma factor (sigma-70 family)